MKKKINITVAKRFPKVHQRAGQPTNFAEKIMLGEKLHTIRKNYDLWAVNAEKMQTGRFVLSVRQWIEEPYKSKQREVFNTDAFVSVERITIQYHAQSDSIAVCIEDKTLDASEVATLIENDGLTEEDFKDWFFCKQRHNEDTTFEGVIVHFTSFRYSNAA